MAKIRGVREIRKAIHRAGPALEDEALEEVRKSSQAMYRAARANLDRASQFAPLYHGGAGMQNITGIARRNYRWSISKRQLKGRVGLLSSTANKKAFYLRFFNDGTVHQPARPFHDRAFEGERDTYLANQGVALRRVLAKLFG